MLDVNGCIYLIDFGLSKIVINSENTKTRVRGTLHFIAPECLDTDETNDDQIISTISTKIDVCAFGCFVSWLFSGYLPWCNKYPDNPSILQTVLLNKKNFPIPNNIKNEFIIKIIENATIVNISDRWNMIKIKDYLDEFC